MTKIKGRYSLLIIRLHNTVIISQLKMLNLHRIGQLECYADQTCDAIRCFRQWADATTESVATRRRSGDLGNES